MRRLLPLLFLLGVFSLALCAREEPAPSPTPQVSAVQKQAGIPEKARAVLQHIRSTGSPPAGYVGGRTWQNRERNLPQGGRYREYDVNPKVKGKNRGPERLVIDQRTGRAWYTSDHYRTFIEIK